MLSWVMGRIKDLRLDGLLSLFFQSHGFRSERGEAVFTPSEIQVLVVSVCPWTFTFIRKLKDLVEVLRNRQV